ncbi:NAD(P)-dependent oxidoreductase [Mycobacterium sp. PS03-16]|uniref:NAD(P)-dependent oxidoreductase n=1 Tax=Mycobacterium sp. PS03-16 TaxID=2559611 RepID=UPI0010744929|nr:NAD(P)-dependent oxidoreductase [Mycobacterium sp. PS03-16]TFV59765.1 NAD(P)-dependent oxidoreductase [Mycobacterium sp. PS03-16]
MTHVGFIGAGRMGAPMVRRLVAAGHEVSVAARGGKSSAIAELGATPVTGIAAAAADLVVVCVFTDEQVREVCLDSGLLPAMAPGATLVIHTTGSPDTARGIAAAASAHGVDVLDAPISGGPHDVAAGALTLFVGGAAEAVDRVAPVLSAYGDPLLHVGPVGAGQCVKLVNNALFAAQIGLLREAVRLGDHLGVAEPDLLTALTHGSSSSRVLTMIAPRGSVGAFVEMAGAFVGKDVDVVRGIAATAGTDLGLLDDAIAMGR